MSRRNQHPGDRENRLIVLGLALLGAAAIAFLVLGMVTANTGYQP